MMVVMARILMVAMMVVSGDADADRNGDVLVMLMFMLIVLGEEHGVDGSVVVGGGGSTQR